MDTFCPQLGQSDVLDMDLSSIGANHHTPEPGHLERVEPTARTAVRQGALAAGWMS
jgi:hypothetical protein